MTFYFFSKKCIPSDLWLIKCCLAYLDFNTTYLHGLGKKKTKTRTSMNKKNVKEKSQENNIPCILRLQTKLNVWDTNIKLEDLQFKLIVHSV